MRAQDPSGRPASPVAELIWQGKSRPSSLAAEPAGLGLDERYAPDGDPTDDDGWRDLLIRGDNVAVLRALLAEPWRKRIEAAGGLRLVYLDPPFLTGQHFVAEVPIGDGAGADGRPRVVRVPAFRDAGPRDLPVYLTEMRERLGLIRELLAEDGSLYLHCDHRLSAYLRLLLDEVFGPDRFVNELVWHYGLGNPGGARAFARKHDTILLYAKTDRYRFNRLRGDVTRAMADKYRHEDEHGRYMLAYGRKYRLKGGKPLDSVWAIPTLAATDGERLGYPTQKPEALLERIVRASSDPGDLVADFCCGCGTLPAVAARLNRRWLACESGRMAIHVTRKRLLALGDRLIGEGRSFLGFDVLTLAGWQPDPPPLAYAVAPRAEAVREHDGVTVHLRGLEVVAPPCDIEALAASLRARERTLAITDGQLWQISRDRGGPPTLQRLTRCWPDWVDGWSVGHRCGNDASTFVSSRHAVRARPRGPLSLASAPIADWAAPATAVVVLTILGDRFVGTVGGASVALGQSVIG